jgi:hypothetical protein
MCEDLVAQYIVHLLKKKMNKLERLKIPCEYKPTGYSVVFILKIYSNIKQEHGLLSNLDFFLL